MSRYVDVTSFCENICRCNNRYCNKQSCPILNAPAADVQKIKHGEWTKDDSGGCYCSACGWYADYDYDYVTYVTNNGLGNGDFNYCPHCVAKMDGGNNNA